MDSQPVRRICRDSQIATMEIAAGQWPSLLGAEGCLTVATGGVAMACPQFFPSLSPGRVKRLEAKRIALEPVPSLTIARERDRETAEQEIFDNLHCFWLSIVLHCYGLPSPCENPEATSKPSSNNTTPHRQPLEFQAQLSHVRQVTSSRRPTTFDTLATGMFSSMYSVGDNDLLQHGVQDSGCAYLRIAAPPPDQAWAIPNDGRMVPVTLGNGRRCGEDCKKKFCQTHQPDYGAGPLGCCVQTIMGHPCLAMM